MMNHSNHNSVEQQQASQQSPEYDVRTSMDICIHIPEQQTTHDYRADSQVTTPQPAQTRT